MQCTFCFLIKFRSIQQLLTYTEVPENLRYRYAVLIDLQIYSFILTNLYYSLFKISDLKMFRILDLEKYGGSLLTMYSSSYLN